MSKRQELETIHGHIFSGRLNEAEAALSQLQPELLHERRMLHHYRAITVFHRGAVADARDLMADALETFGPNVNLLRDWIVCHYHLQDMVAFRAGLTHLELELLKNETSLSPRSLLECELMLGKFLEEEARLAPAILFYERALSRATSPDHRLRALIQQARWQALYQPGSTELSNLYRELISAPTENLSSDLQVELQHSLMLIEQRLIGADHAWQRVERLPSSALEVDKRLLVFDFIEGVLGQDLSLKPAVLDMLKGFQQLYPFEDFLSRLVQDSLAAPSKIQALTDLASCLSWSSYLRLLCLVANTESQLSAKQELHRKIQLIVAGLDPRSQEIWKLRLRQVLQSPEIKIDLCLKARTVEIQGKTVDLSKKKIGLQLLSGLVGQNSLSVDQAITLLWNAEFSPEYYHRLRMLAHRMNTLIHDSTGLGKVIEVDSQSVRLRPQIALRSREESLGIRFSF